MATARASRAPRRRSKSIRWDRVGRTALLLVLGVIVLLYVPPAMRWVEQRQTAARQSAELEELRREHEELEARLESLRGPDAVEREARRLGMVRLGERPVVIEGLPEQP
ncbi:MAG: septum formation initiator family protein [Thermoleophilaceae bacterium]